MSKSKTITLADALDIARAGGNQVARAASRLNGLAAFGMLSPSDGGLLGQAYRDIEDDLPADRDFTVDEWIEATHERHEMPDAADVWRAKQ